MARLTASEDSRGVNITVKAIISEPNKGKLRGGCWDEVVGRGNAVSAGERCEGFNLFTTRT